MNLSFIIGMKESEIKYQKKRVYFIFTETPISWDELMEFLSYIVLPSLKFYLQNAIMGCSINVGFSIPNSPDILNSLWC